MFVNVVANRVEQRLGRGEGCEEKSAVQRMVEMIMKRPNLNRPYSEGHYIFDHCS